VWLDSHCHVTADAFAGDRDQVLERAWESGVEALVAIGSGYGIAHNERAVALAAPQAGSRPRVVATAGVHPHEASELDDAGRARLLGWLDAPGVVAVGECGLDYHYMNSPREVQREVFAEQLTWAVERDLPVSLHVRGDAPDAYGEMLDIWQAESAGRLQGVLHCYTGSLAFARRALDAGLFISFSGILTFASAEDLRDVARALPLERLLVETDAPLLSPVPHRKDRRNEPARVRFVGEVLASAQGVAVQEVARATAANARRLFRLEA
jgi:TatD DNase family protein